MNTAEELHPRLDGHFIDHEPVFVAMPISEFEREVLERLADLHAKMEMLLGNGQPGKVTRLEERLVSLERNDIRRSVYDRLLNAAIAVLISAAIAMHDHFGFK